MLTAIHGVHLLGGLGGMLYALSRACHCHQTVADSNTLNLCATYWHFDNRALDLEPHYAEAWHNKGWALRALGRFSEALECYDRALAINPQLAVTWTNKGNILLTQGCHWEAQACYDRALALTPPKCHCLVR